MRRLIALVAFVAAIGAPFALRAEATPFEVVWVGDILLGDAAQPLLDVHGYEWPFANLLPLLGADYAIGNAEGPITTRTERFFPDQRWSYNADPAAATALAAVGFDALSLANNHAFDRGPEGLADTRRHLTDAGIVSFGAGANDAEALQPLLIETPHGQLAVAGFGANWNFGRVADHDQSGTATLGEEAIVRARDLALAAGARWVVAYVHWGSNYAPVSDAQRRWAAAFAAAGYDLVIGHHPHVVQPVDVVDGMPVIYSLGNFAFGSEGRFSADYPGYGLVATTVIGQSGVGRIELHCIETDNDVVRFQPRPCPSDIARNVVSGLGSRVVWKDGVGVVI